MEWGLVSKHLTPGDRKEYFSAMKDVAAIGRQIAKERRKREVQPVLAALSEVKNISGTGEKEVVFKEVIADLEDFTSRIDRTLEKFIQSDENWFYKQLMSLL
jgi:DNA-binding transcriptional regulator GbsR (MarR family)